MNFILEAVDAASAARAGRLSLSHGEVETPVFMPVGTAGTVKAIYREELREEIQAPIILGNTYHLYLRPGMELLQKAGGLHGFSGWDRPLLTDSGGYQVYSLSQARKITKEGVQFRSHIDGSMHTFSPESIVDIQRIIGADIMMAFDECPPYPCEYNYARESMTLTHDWLERCYTQFASTENIYGYRQLMFPIVQGGTFSDLRKQSAEFVASKEPDGCAIGGLSVGEPDNLMYDMAGLSCEVLPKDKPRYLMGVGTPENILESISLGIDMFDCVMPTRNGRNGMLFTTEGIINIRNEKWKHDLSPIDPGIQGVSTNYSRAYLRHLVISKEMLGAQIASKHNLSFYIWLLREARSRIKAGDFGSWKEKMKQKVARRL